jgi:hypothetical protein
MKASKNKSGDWGGENLFRLRNVTPVGYFYYLVLLKLLHGSVLRPSSGRNILEIYSDRFHSWLQPTNVSYILKKTTDPLSVEWILADIFLLEDGRTTETCSSLSNIK